MAACKSTYASSTTPEFIDAVNALLSKWNTRLVGGNPEPLYVPPTPARPAEVRYTRDSIRSALHELAHWCIAGEERRKVVDYGYWYRPDGRSPSEQEEFFQFEMKPQALELAFTQALNIPFEVSCDNLSGEKGDVLKFAEDVSSQLSNYRANGLPPRAAELLQVLVSQSAGK